MKRPLILASASPRRQQLLRLIRPDFVVVAADVPEPAWEYLTPSELCQLNAHHKARAVAKQHPDALVIGADTEVSLGAKVFGKPANMREAIAMLEALSGRTHEVLSGVCLLHLRSHQEKLFVETTRVTFHPLSRARIIEYLGRIRPFDKAGAYAIQESGETIIEHMEGSFSNVVGLPVGRLRQELKAW